MKTQAIYFSHRLNTPAARLTLNGWNIPFMNHVNGQNIPFTNNVKYIGVIINKRTTWRLYMKMTEANAFTTIIRTYSLFESKRLSASIKLYLQKALITSVMTYACLRICDRQLPLKIPAPTKQGSLQNRKFSKVHTSPWFAHGFQPSVGI
jgi:hypothetical protein